MSLSIEALLASIPLEDFQLTTADLYSNVRERSQLHTWSHCVSWLVRSLDCFFNRSLQPSDHMNTPQESATDAIQCLLYKQHVRAPHRVPELCQFILLLVANRKRRAAILGVPAADYPAYGPLELEFEIVRSELDEIKRSMRELN